jgi:uncharacterized protein YbjQ (UPF0145 family)
MQGGQIMILTTTPTVEGKRIKEYLGIVSGTDIYLVGGLFGGGLANQENLFGSALNSATSTMKSKAFGADAIVGIRTEVLSPGNLNNIIVVVTGTAVKLEDANESDELPDL